MDTTLSAHHEVERLVGLMSARRRQPATRSTARRDHAFFALAAAILTPAADALPEAFPAPAVVARPLPMAA